MSGRRCILALFLPGAALLALGATQQPAIDPAWLRFEAASRTARLQLIAGLTGVNGALTFNGFRDGGLSLVVPRGWATEIDFRNHGASSMWIRLRVNAPAKTREITAA